MENKLKIAIGVPTNRLIKAKTVKSLMDLIVYSPEINFELIVATRGYNTSENRNYIAAQALQKKCDYLFFVDDDMILPSNTLSDLLLCDKDIVGGIYNTKYEVQTPVVEFLNEKGNNGLFKVKAIGTGCLLIKTDVFKQLPQPWFKYEWNDNGSIKRSHDWIFCEDARKAGIKVWANHDLKIKHIGQYEF